MKVLISGSTGFVGTNLIPYLRSHLPDCEIIALTRSTLAKDHEILWEELAPADLEGVETIIHLAGKAHDTKNTSDEKEYYRVNYELTKELYDLFLKSTAKKFVYLSSVKAAADKVEGSLTEDSTPDPQTPYGKSKLLAEEYIQKAAVYDMNKRFYILRPCMIHGPGNKGNLNLLYKFAKLGIPYPLAAFENMRSFLSVENLSFIIAQLLQGQIASGVYQVADDTPLSTNDLIKLMSAVQNRSEVLWNIPTSIIHPLAKIGDILRLPFNSERLQKLTESYVVSNEKIKSALCVPRLPVGTEEGLITTIRSFAN